MFSSNARKGTNKPEGGKMFHGTIAYPVSPYTLAQSGLKMDFATDEGKEDTRTASSMAVL